MVLIHSLSSQWDNSAHALSLPPPVLWYLIPLSCRFNKQHSWVRFPRDSPSHRRCRHRFANCTAGVTLSGFSSSLVGFEGHSLPFFLGALAGFSAPPVGACYGDCSHGAFSMLQRQSRGSWLGLICVPTRCQERDCFILRLSCFDIFINVPVWIS